MRIISSIEWTMYINDPDAVRILEKCRKLEEENKRLQEEVNQLKIELVKEKGRSGKKWTPTNYII